METRKWFDFFFFFLLSGFYFLRVTARLERAGEPRWRFVWCGVVRNGLSLRRWIGIYWALDGLFCRRDGERSDDILFLCARKPIDASKMSTTI